MKILLSSIFILLSFATSVRAASPGDVVLNEIAWMGTTNSPNDEWIELYNNTDTEISLSGWVLKSTDGTPTINISLENGVSDSIPPKGFFLLERTDDTSVPDQQADQIYTGALNNSTGEHLELLDVQGNPIDNVNAWGKVLWEGFGGDKDTKRTMERKNPKLAGADSASWETSIDPGGTPKAQNSIYQSGETSPPPPPPASDPQPEADQPLAETPEPEPETEPSSELTATSTPNQSSQSSDGTGQAPESATSSASSSQANLEQPLQQIVYPVNIFINELMPSPLGSDAEEEWIEIINESDNKADISFWQIRDTLGAINTYTFPDGSFIAAHAFLVLSRVTSRITMNNTEDAIELLRPNGEVAQTIPYSKAPKGQSYARTETIWEWSTVPTPGSANIVSQPQAKTKKAPVYKAKNTTLKNTSINTTQNSTDSTKETPATAIQDPAASTSPAQTAAIGGVGPQTGNTLMYIIASLVALLSATFIFLLKKRLQS